MNQLSEWFNDSHAKGILHLKMKIVIIHLTHVVPNP